MNNVPFVPRSPAGRKIHDLARRHVRDDHDLRGAVHRALAERSGSTGPLTDDWTRPALDIRRRVTPPTQADQENGAMMQPAHGTPADIPPPLHYRRWLREGLKLVAAAIVCGIVGALLVLVLRGGDDGPRDSVPGVNVPASPSAQITATPATSSTTTASANPTVLTSPTVPAVTAPQATSTARALAGTATANETATANASLPSPGEVVATIDVGARPWGVVATDNALWVLNVDDGTISRIDPATNTVVATVTGSSADASGGEVLRFNIAAYQGQVWVTNDSTNALERIDPATNQVVQTIMLADGIATGAFVVDASGIWLAHFEGQQLLHIDPVSGAVVTTLDMYNPSSLASGSGSLWVITGADTNLATLVRIDAASNTIVTQIPLGIIGAANVSIGAGSVWVSDWSSSTIVRIDPTTNTVVATIDSSLEEGFAILATDSGVWVSSRDSAGVVRIDPTTNQPGQIIDTDHLNSFAIAQFSDGSIWISHPQADVVTRIDPAP